MNLPPALELNPRHKLIRALAASADAGEDVGEAAHTLLDLARVQDGEVPADPAAFARRVTQALASGALASGASARATEKREG